MDGGPDDIAGLRGPAGLGPDGEHLAGAAFHNAPTPMFVADHDAAIVLVNAAFRRLTGYTRRELGDRPWPELLAEGDRHEGWELHRRALHRSSERRELTLTDRDGRPRHAAVEAGPLEADDAGPAVGAVVCCAPAYDQRAVRAAVEARTENADSALWTVDLTSGALSELLGPSPLGRQIIGNPPTMAEFLSRVHRDDAARLRDALEEAGAGADYEQRFRLFDHDGEERWLHARARYLAGPPPRLAGVVDDVTEHVQLVRRLADRRRIEAAQVRRVNELAAKMVSATTAGEIVRLLTDAFPPIFAGHSAEVLLADDGGLHPPPAPTPGKHPPALVSTSRPEDEAYPMGAVFRDRRSRFFESRSVLAEHFPAAAELPAGTGARSWAIVPIFGDRRIALGVWQVTWDRPHNAAPDERALMLTLAGLAGQALQRVNAQQAELELADAVQRRMLPSALPEPPGLDLAVRYLPSRAGWRVCGDFYDAIELPSRKVGLVVGDVQGHGVEAAAAMGQIRMAFRAYATTRRDPGDAIAETNRLLSATGEVVFATCGYLVLDPTGGEMRAAWAGQPPAIIATSEEYRIWQPETGPPLGVDGDAEYPVTAHRLAARETLLMCSDGLVESSAVTMDHGLSRAGATLRDTATDVHAAASSLAELAPAGRGDDIAILIARMR